MTPSPEAVEIEKALKMEDGVFVEYIWARRVLADEVLRLRTLLSSPSEGEVEEALAAVDADGPHKPLTVGMYRVLAAALRSTQAELKMASEIDKQKFVLLARAEAAERDRDGYAMKLTKALNECGRLSSELGEMQGKYEAAHWPGIVEGWKERTEAAERECQEQARLNGMGAERELALRSKLEAAESRLASAERIVECARKMAKHLEDLDAAQPAPEGGESMSELDRLRADAACKFVDDANGDERVSLNLYYSEGLVLAYRSLRSALAAEKEAREKAEAENKHLRGAVIYPVPDAKRAIEQSLLLLQRVSAAECRRSAAESKLSAVEDREKRTREAMEKAILRGLSWTPAKDFESYSEGWTRTECYLQAYRAAWHEIKDAALSPEPK
jgi:hypothetical protein